jgi:phage terminase large subunit
MFRGIKTSSGNQTAKLKSIHGITTFIVDEAEEWASEKEFETIMLSIRQTGIQNRIIIIMNPTDNNHWVYKRFIEKTHKEVMYDGVSVQISTNPNVLHIHTTYLDNLENLSPEFLKEVEEMKVNDPEKYAHTVIGRWADVAKGAVFKHVSVVREFPKWCKHVAVGQDFGYTNDPSASIRCGVIGNDLYLDEIDYRTGLLSSDIIKVLRPYGLKVIADSADPRLIQEIHNGGVKIYPVEKGPGSINAGIDKMQSMNIFVTEHSYNLRKEFRNYVWAKDKDGNYINEPEDHDNHGIDAARYYILGELLGRIQKPRIDIAAAFAR